MFIYHSNAYFWRRNAKWNYLSLMMFIRLCIAAWNLDECNILHIMAHSTSVCTATCRYHLDMSNICDKMTLNPTQTQVSVVTRLGAILKQNQTYPNKVLWLYFLATESDVFETLCLPRRSQQGDIGVSYTAWWNINGLLNWILTQRYATIWLHVQCWYFRQTIRHMVHSRWAQFMINLSHRLIWMVYAMYWSLYEIIGFIGKIYIIIFIHLITKRIPKSAVYFSNIHISVP